MNREALQKTIDWMKADKDAHIGWDMRYVSAECGCLIPRVNLASDIWTDCGDKFTAADILQISARDANRLFVPWINFGAVPYPFDPDHDEKAKRFYTRENGIRALELFRDGDRNPWLTIWNEMKEVNNG